MIGRSAVYHPNYIIGGELWSNLKLMAENIFRKVLYLIKTLMHEYIIYVILLWLCLSE
jgi:hypothetical protein